MNTLRLTNKELVMLQEAVDMFHDMKNDMSLDDLWVGQEVKFITREALFKMRDATDKKIDELQSLTLLKDKIDRLG